MNSPPLRRVAPPILIVVVAAIAVAVLYGRAVTLWWTYDDAYLLRIAGETEVRQYFHDGHFWRGTPGAMFVPVLHSMYDAGFHLFGLEPGAWHAGVLVLLAAAAAAVALTVRMVTGTFPAIAAGLLWVSGAAVCTLATQIMLVHYSIAIVLMAASTAAFLMALRKRSMIMSVVAAALYLAAMLAKEIAVPLLALLVLVPERDRRLRVRYLIAPACAFLAYLAWRWAMIGTLLGGYGWAIERHELPALLLSLPVKLIRLCAGASLPAGLVAVALVIAGALLAMRNWTAARIGLVTLVMAVAPIVPVSKQMEGRYAVMTWLWASVAFAFGVASLPRRWGSALAAVALAATIYANRQQWRVEYGRSDRMSDEGRAWMRLRPNELLRLPAVPPAAMMELHWLKEIALRRQSGAGWFYDDLYLCTAGVDGKRVFRYDAKVENIVEATAETQRWQRQFCGSIRPGAPLSAAFEYRDDALFWTFGPYQDGAWRVIIGGGLQAFDVPRTGGFRLPGLPGMTLRVRYVSPAGWTTYSPEVELDFVRRPRTSWRR